MNHHLLTVVPAREPSSVARAVDRARRGWTTRKIAGGITRFPATVLVTLIRFYQRTVSPLLPAFFGPQCGCRFYPSCSHYAAQAIAVHGAWRGAGLTLLRLVKCTPLHSGGWDPVPVRTAGPRRWCERVSATRHTA